MAPPRVIRDQMDAHRWMQEHLDGPPAYPGHPLVLAAIIMHSFDCFNGANKPTGNGWCEALSDCRVPGAGDHVDAAMRILCMGHGGATADEMVAEANRYWTSGKAGGHVKNVDAGSAQSIKIEPLFRAKAESWFKSNPVAA
ncbi:hypothetical protein Bsp3421_000067 (plasmid) [Burkholderia sp. FERM BP-3421]|uniref:hypothetical protein n=1 Tax=Burkholderia sp. FERM BP-3421 TaxID=1494466 RepID=UPI002362FF45|nr:hypothetical protein [Burkholderia sp. FERM BP-3421]WDD90246.1 hypothetical protein Bsp3421_000067 [Burkholderia sp. FERM BP-3421]